MLKAKVFIGALFLIFILSAFLFYHNQGLWSYFFSGSRLQYENIVSRAETGNPEAQLQLGILYANGDYVKQDYSKAFQWYLSAARQGNAAAQRNLGLLYECGVGVDQDYAEAIRWYKKAVENHDQAAGMGIAGYHFAYRESLLPRWYGNFDFWRYRTLFLSLLQKQQPERHFWEIYTKEVNAQNDASIVRIVKERAEAGDSDAQLRMALFYLQGQGVSQSLSKMNYWLRRSADTGNGRAKFIICKNSFKKSSIQGYPNENIFNSELNLAIAENIEPFFRYFRDGPTEDLVRSGYIPAIKQVWMSKNAISEYPNIQTHIEQAAEEGDAEAMVYILGQLIFNSNQANRHELAGRVAANIIATQDLAALQLLNDMYCEQSKSDLIDFIGVTPLNRLGLLDEYGCFIRGFLCDTILGDLNKAARFYTLSSTVLNPAGYIALKNTLIKAGADRFLIMSNANDILFQTAYIYDSPQAYLYKLNSDIDEERYTIATFRPFSGKHGMNSWTTMLMLISKLNYYRSSTLQNAGSSLSFETIFRKLQNNDMRQDDSFIHLEHY